MAALGGVRDPPIPPADRVQQLSQLLHLLVEAPHPLHRQATDQQLRPTGLQPITHFSALKTLLNFAQNY